MDSIKTFIDENGNKDLVITVGKRFSRIMFRKPSVEGGTVEDFSKPFFSTVAATEAVGWVEVCAKIAAIVSYQSKKDGGYDYLMKGITDKDEAIWIIDNGEYVTLMTPDEY